VLAAAMPSLSIFQNSILEFMIYAVGSLLASVLFQRLSVRYDKLNPQAT
jgi:hypothetical protein